MQPSNPTAPAAPFATLYLQWVDGAGDCVPLSRTTISIGRRPENDIVIEHPAISGQHLEITYRQGSLFVRDLGSRNGSFLNGQRLAPAQPTAVQPGAVIRLHNCLDLRLTPPDPGVPAGQMPAHLFLAARPQPGLLVWQRDGAAQRVLLSNRPLTIGRRPDNDVVINNHMVSGHHAQVRPIDEGHFGISDLESTNGLRYHGQPIKSKPLRPGDTLTIGDQVIIQFQAAVCLFTQAESKAPAVSTETQLLKLEARKTIRIGRAEDNELHIDDNRVSRYHAVIERIGMRYRIRDLHSDNGTFVNDKRVEKEQFIAEGDSIRVAGTRFQFVEDGLEQVDASSGLRMDLVRLNKFVDKNKNLIQDISLSIYPREFVALVGTSGAGKSTLLDAMNGFRPATHGQVLINGVDLYRHFDAYRTELGYVPQDDIMHRELTVYEALDYAARLRMPSDTSPQERSQRVHEVLRELDLEGRKDLPIHKLSGGQRKRVSIGVELLTRPRLFFLDEATSGLDPGTELELMNLLRQLTEDPREGRTIILITHATKNVMLCDKVIFLTKGGYLAFYGPPDEALQYFDQYRTQEERRLKPDFEFDDIYGLIDPDKRLGESASEKEKLALAAQWGQRYRQSAAYQKYVADRLRQHAQPGAQPGEMQASSTGIRRAPRTSAWRQFGILTARSLTVMKHDSKSLAVLLLQAPLIGVFSFVNFHKDLFTTGNGHVGNQGDALQTLFLAVIIVLLFGTVNGAREITKEIAVYRRERMVNLKILPYVFSKVLIGAMFCAYQVAIYLAFTLITIDWPHAVMGMGGWGQLYLTLFICSLSGIMLGLLLSALASNDGQAVALIPVILIPQFIFAGILMPELAKTPVVPTIATSRWAMAALANITKIESLPLAIIPDAQKTDPAELQKNAEYVRKAKINEAVDQAVAEQLDAQVQKAMDEQVPKQVDAVVASEKAKAQDQAEAEARRQMAGNLLINDTQREQQVQAARQKAAGQVDAQRPQIEAQVRQDMAPQVRQSVEKELRAQALAKAEQEAPPAVVPAMPEAENKFKSLYGTNTYADWAAMTAILLALLGIILMLQKRKDVV